MNASKRFKVKVAAHVIVKSGASILIVLRKSTGYMDDMWGLPSGHVEQDEFPTQTAIRETQEETTLVI